MSATLRARFLAQDARSSQLIRELGGQRDRAANATRDRVSRIAFCEAQRNA